MHLLRIAEATSPLGSLEVDADAVLIAEIPKSGDRWNQANFDLETFRNYFGAIPGHTQRIILTHIDSEGRVGTGGSSAECCCKQP